MGNNSSQAERTTFAPAVQQASEAPRLSVPVEQPVEEYPSLLQLGNKKISRDYILDKLGQPEEDEPSAPMPHFEGLSRTISEFHASRELEKNISNRLSLTQVQFESCLVKTFRQEDNLGIGSLSSSQLANLLFKLNPDFQQQVGGIQLELALESMKHSFGAREGWDLTSFMHFVQAFSEF